MHCLVLIGYIFISEECVLFLMHLVFSFLFSPFQGLTRFLLKISQMHKRFKCLDVMWAPPFGVLPLLQFLPVSVAQRRYLPWLWSREASSLWCVSPVAYRPLASPGGRMVSVCQLQEMLHKEIKTWRLSGWYDSYLTCELMRFRFWAEGGPTIEDSVRRPPAADLQRWEDRCSLLHLHGIECIWLHF